MSKTKNDYQIGICERKRSHHHDSCYKLLYTSLALSFILCNQESFLIEADASEQSYRHLIGVQPGRRHLYELGDDQSFKCLDGSGSIPISFVNDDYCDCRDASDEPGTAACPHGRFYCSNDGYLQRLIPSAWVNDGQCDCCDSSDEYNSSSSCENNCQILGEIYRKEQEKFREIADQGSAIRSQYKEQAKQRKEQNAQLLEQYRREVSEKENAIKKLEEELNSDFGPAHVFFPLKGKCFGYTDHEYTYNLCPFERATQESTSGMQTELGRWAGWVGPSDNVYSRQKYEGGMQCWNGPARSVLVNIACGVEDKLTSVTEPAKCEYVYHFITPAACPDLDPPEQPSPENIDQQSPSTDASDSSSNLEVEEDPLNIESTTNFPDDTGEAPADDEKHDEL